MDGGTGSDESCFKGVASRKLERPCRPAEPRVREILHFVCFLRLSLSFSAISETRLITFTTGHRLYIM